MPSVLITGFGPFPGAPVNPTEQIVRNFARMKRLRGHKLATHAFATSYAAVDRNLPRLIAKHRPRALIMFGLAANTRRTSASKRWRITTSAANTSMSPARSRRVPRSALPAPRRCAAARRSRNSLTPHAPQASRRSARKTPAATSAITFTGAPSRRRKSPAARNGSCSSMSRNCAAVKFRAASLACIYSRARRNGSPPP